MTKRPSSRDWPQVKGDFNLGDPSSPCAVAVVGRGEVELPSDSYAIQGRFKTENLGVEKIVMNIISNPCIRFLVVCGREEFGHFPADAILMLHQNGVDGDMRIMGTRAAVPFLCNTPREAVSRFREQVELIDLVHPKNVGEIIEYDPVYHFEAERTEELIITLENCRKRDPGPLGEVPMIVGSNGLDRCGGEIGDRMNRLADQFTGQMLRMPSERLSTRTSLAEVSREFNIILDPVDMRVMEVPSIDLASRLKGYLMGE